LAVDKAHANIKRGECVGVVYWSTAFQEWRIHDGVLKSPATISNGLKPPKSITIIHYTVHQSGKNKGDLNRDECFHITNPLYVLRTPTDFTKAVTCPKISGTKIPKGKCVVVKIKVNDKAHPSGRDAKNGRLLCPVGNPNKPKTVWINHWVLFGNIKNPAVKPKYRLVSTGYKNTTFVKALTPNNKKKCP